MFANIARFEFRYVLRNPLLWVTAALTFALFFLAISIGGFGLGSEGGLLDNAAYATVRNYQMISILFMFVTASFIANAVVRDDETGFGPIIRCTPITKPDYLLGRFVGAFGVAAACLLLVSLGIWLGALMPWTDHSVLGPNRLADHLYGYFVFGLPNLFIHSAVLFALATITRSMMATYLGVVGFIGTFFFLQDAYRRPQLVQAVAIAEPFGSRALKDAVRYWTIEQRNGALPDFTGTLLYNRLLWIGIAVFCLGLACYAYRFAERTPSVKKQRGSSDDRAPVVAASLPDPRHDNAAVLWMRTRFEIKQVVKSAPFVLLLAWGLYTTLFVLVTQRYPDGRPTYPTTLSLIPEIEDAFSVMLLVVAIYYAGELVWRERDRRVHELIDASPLPNWAYVIPKTAAMALVLVSLLLVNVGASVILQLSLGWTRLEPGQYLLWYVLPATFDMLLLAALAMFVQSLSRHKAIGWGIMVLFLMWQHVNKFITHNLLNYSGKPAMPLSDMNGADSFWIGPWAFRLYWGAFAALLLVASHLLWRRGTEVRLRPRWSWAWRRLGGRAGWVAEAALLAFVATGVYAYYNTNILNGYRTQNTENADAARFEKLYWKYHDLPQPRIAGVTLNINLYPDEHRAVIEGRHVLRNLTRTAISDIHVRVLDSDLELTRAAIAGARVILNDAKYKYRIYRLDSPMRPGEERVLTFETRRWHRGFRNGDPNTRLVRNGTFLDTPELMPVVGMSGWGTLQDPATRRKYGLPDELPRTKAEELAAIESADLGVGWTKADITVSTSADQTPIAPGKKISDVTRGGRRTAHFVSTTPILTFFSVQSARYAEKHRMHAGVDLGIYYHPAHPWNVDRMLDTLALSLDYYQANLGPYPFDHVRIVEFPGYRYFAQAFAGTIPYSETLGFVADFRAPETIDYVAFTTAHELGHQYWGHQVTGAAVPGSSILSEGLASYSAMMVMKKMYGEDKIRLALQTQLDRYLGGRSYGPKDEPPLVRVENESYIDHRKSAVVMYLVQKRLGEEAVNRALRSLLHRYKFKGPPFPRCEDLVTALRAEAKTPEQQALITDLFERVTLYNLKVTNPTATRRPDGKWNVTVPVEAKKVYVANSVETETPIAESIETGLFTAEPGRDAFDSSNVIVMERRPIHSGRQVLQFVSDRKPLYAGIDPYNFYIDRDSTDNVVPLEASPNSP